MVENDWDKGQHVVLLIDDLVVRESGGLGLTGEENLSVLEVRHLTLWMVIMPNRTFSQWIKPSDFSSLFSS